MHMNANLKNVHDELLTLLKDFDKICSENNINYSIAYGTAIGAVRHKGFIPWDDDADVVMNYKNYCKLRSVLPNEFEIHQTRVWVPRFKKKNKLLDIDIFVLYRISDNKFKRNIKVFMIRFLQGTLKNKPTLTKGAINSLLSIATYLIGNLFSQSKKIKLYNAVSLNVFNGNSLLFSAYDDFTYIKKTFPIEILSSYSKVPFEDTELMLLDKYDDFLTIVYGDYMIPPAADERVPNHGHIEKVNSSR